jgi:hypothetical protein
MIQSPKLDTQTMTYVLVTVPDARRYTAIRPDRRLPRDFPNEHRTLNIQRRTSKFSCVGHLDLDVGC